MVALFTGDVALNVSCYCYQIFEFSLDLLQFRKTNIIGCGEIFGASTHSLFYRDKYYHLIEYDQDS